VNLDKLYLRLNKFAYQFTIMFEHQIKFRVLYSDTDKMGYMYYGQYAKYLEMGRVEALRSLGLSYKSMEDSGVMMPVLELNTKYIKPLFYDDEITLVTKVVKMPDTRIYFKYELLNPARKLATVAETTLVFVDCSTGKPCLIPANFKSKIETYFQ
jgi:acyl-CoA thioester hydrolase